MCRRVRVEVIEGEMATHQEVYDAAMEYYGGDDLATKTWVDKYALRDLDGDYKEMTPDDMHRRLAGEFARIEKKYKNPRSEEEIYQSLRLFNEIVPQGSPMAVIGNPYQVVSAANCVLIESPEDSIHSIMDAGKNLAQLFKRRCGCGICLSNLRPEGTVVNNAARTTTGAWSFADFFSNVCRMIGQNSRRGALAITLDVRHPDVFKFAAMKKDLTKTTGANISIKFTDGFMEAVRDDKEFTLQWPVESKNPKITRVIRARDLWEVVVKSARDSAEPGVLFWDTICRELPADYYAEDGFKTNGINPCFAGDTMIAVADGRNAVSIKQLAEEGLDVPVYSVDPVTGILSIKQGRSPRITGCEKPLVRVWLDNGTYIDTTATHGFMLRDGTKRCAEELVPGDSLSPFYKKSERIKKGGSRYYRVYTDTRTPQEKKIYEHRLIARYFYPDLWEETYNSAKTSGWVKGGLVVHHKDYDSLNNHPQNLEILSFKNHAKLHSSKDAGYVYNHRVAKVEPLAGLHTVYNITVDDNHTVAVVVPTKNKKGEVEYTGVNTFQCSELTLNFWGSCCLTTVNLYGFVRNRFQEDAYFDYQRFNECVRLAQRVLDDIIDLEIENIDRILKVADSPDEKRVWRNLKQSCEKGRRTGLGTFGLADALACLGLRYDSEEAIEQARLIFEAFRNASYSESVNLAKERGPFPVWDWEKEKKCPFIKRLPVALRKDIKKFGRRNIANMTNAPTGSVAIVSFNRSSGIEPVFRNFYTRRKKINHDDEQTRVDFVDHMGDKWQEFNVFHKNAADWLKQQDPEWDGETDVSLPDFFICSDEIDWGKGVEIQGVIQQYIDHAISRTVNLPEGTTVETVSSVYMKAWEQGLKGVTVYVEGTRAGVLISKGSCKEADGRPKTVKRTHAPRRPPVLPCDIYHGRVQNEQWTIVVGLLGNEPYELFGGPSEEAGIPKSAKQGYLTKISRGKNKNQYNLTYTKYNEEVVLEDVGNAFENSAYGTFTRVLSLSLRHGTPIQHMVEQLRKDQSEALTSLSAVLGRALKKYIQDGTIVSSARSGCGRCGSSNLKYSDGCPVCLSCGHTRCI